MLDHFGNAGQPCGDDGHAAAHGFEDGDRQALMVRQEHENLVLCQLFGHVVHIAGPFDVGQALCAGAQLLSRSIGAVAQQACCGLQVLPGQQSQRVDQQVVPFGRGHAGDHDDAQLACCLVTAPRHVGNGVVDDADAAGVHGQARCQCLLVRRDADHAGGPGGQRGFSQPGVATDQSRGLGFEAETMNGVHHGQLRQFAGQPCDDPGHSTVRMKQQRLVLANECQQGLNRCDDFDWVERIAQTGQRNDLHAHGLEGHAERAVGIWPADHRSELHPISQGLAQLHHMRLRPTGFAFGDHQHDVWARMGQMNGFAWDGKPQF